MHELPMIESMVKTVLKVATENKVSKVVTVSLKIGDMRDFIEDMMEQYFAYCTKGTVAEGAKLLVEKVPISVRCNDCSEITEAERLEWIRSPKFSCKHCGSENIRQVSGSEFIIQDIGVM